MSSLTEWLNICHHFTVLYFPWSNRTVERLEKKLLRVARAVLSELQLPQKNLTELFPLLQSAINNTPSPSRQNKASLTVFTGRSVEASINMFIHMSTSVPNALNQTQNENFLTTQNLMEFIEQLHAMVNKSLQRHRLCTENALNCTVPNFQESYYALVPREKFSASKKLCLRWWDPRRVFKPLMD